MLNYSKIGFLFFIVFAYIFSFPCYAEEFEKYYEQGLNALEEEKYEKAVIFFKKSLEIDSNNDNIYALIGLSYILLEKNSEAMKYFKKALKLNPDNEKANVGLGMIYYDKDDKKSASKYLKKHWK